MSQSRRHGQLSRPRRHGGRVPDKADSLWQTELHFEAREDRKLMLLFTLLSQIGAEVQAQPEVLLRGGSIGPEAEVQAQHRHHGTEMTK